MAQGAGHCPRLVRRLRLGWASMGFFGGGLSLLGRAVAAATDAGSRFAGHAFGGGGGWARAAAAIGNVADGVRIGLGAAGRVAHDRVAAVPNTVRGMHFKLHVGPATAPLAAAATLGADLELPGSGDQTLVAQTRNQLAGTMHHVGTQGQERGNPSALPLQPSMPPPGSSAQTQPANVAGPMPQYLSGVPGRSGQTRQAPSGSGIPGP
jgi:hypothetical protein